MILPLISICRYCCRTVCKSFQSRQKPPREGYNLTPPSPHSFCDVTYCSFPLHSPKANRPYTRYQNLLPWTQSNHGQIYLLCHICLIVSHCLYNEVQVPWPGNLAFETLYELAPCSVPASCPTTWSYRTSVLAWTSHRLLNTPVKIIPPPSDTSSTICVCQNPTYRLYWAQMTIIKAFSQVRLEIIFPIFGFFIVCS